MEGTNSWMNIYPRPQLKRNSFLSLNGIWKCNEKDILVPFCPQAQASLYEEEVTDELIYQRDFVLPDDFANDNHVLLHFGAVDQICEVYLNKYYVGKHAGGYLPFEFDITAYLKKENHLTVMVKDELNSFYPYGKQTKQPKGMWYTAVSGIWQSVWLEAVPEHYIKNVKITPHEHTIDLFVDTKLRYTVTIPIGNQIYRQSFYGSYHTIDLSSYQLRYWNVDDPYLYNIVIETETDKVESYFALRVISIETFSQQKRLCINHQPLFIHGVLDQGYFPKGHFIPETPDGYKQDILSMKELGFNMLRKHIKIEPDIFYYYCDQLGMLVVQDMVNSGPYSYFKDTWLPNIGLKRRKDTFSKDKDRKNFFKNHCFETLQHLYNHPSVIIYTIFNEGWGQFDSDNVYSLLKEKDPTRLYDSTSGWFRQKQSDFESIHMYFKNKHLTSDTQLPLFLSECGGYIRKIDGHINTNQTYGYGEAENESELTDKIINLYQTSVIPCIKEGMCGCVYTQLSDIEDELNGLYTYDREVCKVNKQQMKEIKKRIDEELKNI